MWIEKNVVPLDYQISEYKIMTFMKRGFTNLLHHFVEEVSNFVEIASKTITKHKIKKRALLGMFLLVFMDYLINGIDITKLKMLFSIVQICCWLEI